MQNACLAIGHAKNVVKITTESLCFTTQSYGSKANFTRIGTTHMRAALIGATATHVMTATTLATNATAKGLRLKDSKDYLNIRYITRKEGA